MAEGKNEVGDEISWRAVRAEAARRFGIQRFRPGQRELIEAALSGQNAIGILPTGAGKSLCFQLPALFLKKIVVVVSPLIALMQDQLAHLEQASIEAARLDSTVAPADQLAREKEIRRGLHDIVLLTPERLQNPERIAPLKNRVALLVIDEAHCISQWGHDFRPAYLELRHVIQELGNPAVLALTATAPPELLEDMVEKLGLDDVRVVQTGIERENLFMEVARTVNREEKEQCLLDLIASTPGSGIVYLATVKRVNELHAWLTQQGIAAERYHGQMSKRDRQAAQERFMTGATPLMVATNAFGLGIDKPDVRFVVHWHFPASVESYYQEAGRAGRDGKPARCVLFYRLEDKRIRSFFLGGNRPRQSDLSSLVRAFVKSEAAEELTLKEVAALSGLPPRRVAVLTAALEELQVLKRHGRKLRLDRQLRSKEIDAFVAEFDAQYAAERERLKLMMRYGEIATCRMQFLREYFGESPGSACEHCDNCVNPPTATQLRIEKGSGGLMADARRQPVNRPSLKINSPLD